MHEEQLPTKSVIQPGTSKAILMMANGEKVVLDQEQKLDIQLNERVRVASSGQGIVYEGNGKGEVKEEYNKLVTPTGGEYSLSVVGRNPGIFECSFRVEVSGRICWRETGG